MDQRRLTGLLIMPSLFSLSCSALLATGLLLITNWSSITPDSTLYDYLFGPYGLTTIFQESSSALSAVNGVFDNRGAYHIAVAIFAVIVGLLVYMILQGVDRVKEAAQTEINEVAYVSDAAAKSIVRKQNRLRIGIRLTALVLWIVFIVFFARVILPYCILLGQIDVDTLWSWDALSSLLGAFAILMATLHIHVVLMRLLVLRPRFFGSDDILMGSGRH